MEPLPDRAAEPLGFRDVAIPAWAWIAVAVIVVATLGATVVPDPELASLMGNLGVMTGFTSAGVLFVRRSKVLPRGERLAWTAVGLGFFVGISGAFVILIQIAVTGEAAAFGPADVFFFVGYLIALSGFASLPHAAGGRWHRTRVALDALVGAVSLGTLAWIVVLAPIAPRLASAPVWERIIGSLFPFLDVAVFVALMIVIVRRSSYRFDIRVALFGVGIAFQVVADILYLRSGVGRTFAEAQPVFPLYGIATICYIATALIVGRTPPPREYANRKTPLWAMVLPYTAAAVMAVFLLASIVTSDLSINERILVVATLVVVALVITRQAVAIRENRMLLEDQRSVLVSSISHELRTPLTSLVGFLDLLTHATSFDAAEREEMLGIVYDQATYMARIVSDLVMLSRGDLGELSLDVRRVDAGRLVEAAVVASGVPRGSVTIDLDEGVEVYVDPDRLEQALVNLLTNAARYGGPQRLIRVVAAGGGDLVIEVHDDGPGVPRKHEIIVWDRFERGPNRYNATIPGSGIGLAIVKAVATAHGGTAGYRVSEILGGACFSLVLPGRIARVGTDQVRPDETARSA